MKRDLFKINGYISGSDDFIQDKLFEFIQKEGLYFIGTVNKDKMFKLDGYIFSDSNTAEDIQSGFNALMEKYGYYYTGKFNIEYGEIKINI